MKHPIYILTLLIFGISITYGQEDTIIDGVKYNHVTYYNDGSIKELGNYLIEGKKKIKHGNWIIYDRSSEVVEKGNYNKGVKDGFWTERGGGNACCWSGSYKKGKKDGDWFNGVNRVKVYKNGKVKGVKIINWGT